MAMTKEEILAAIKEKVLSVIPDATVMLFGSRARGDWHDESDWDILVLTDQEVTHELDDKVFDAVYPITLEIFNPINFILVNEKDWLINPSYYALSLRIRDEKITI